MKIVKVYAEHIGYFVVKKNQLEGVTNFIITNPPAILPKDWQNI